MWSWSLRGRSRLRRKLESLSHLAQLTLLALVVFALLLGAGRLIRPLVYGVDNHVQTGKELVFGLLGAIDAKPEADWVSVGYSAFVRLLGAVVFGGVITSFLCARVDRYADKRKKGLLVPALRNHFVVVGYGAVTDDLIRTLLAPETGMDIAHWIPQERTVRKRWAREASGRKVILCTGGDVEKIRETLEAVLPRSISSRIVYAFGDMSSGPGQAAVCERLCMEHARQIYVVGDEAASSAGDVENLAFAKGVGAYLEKHASKRPNGLPKPVFVRLDGGASFDFVKKISFATVPTDGRKIEEVSSFFKPFSFTEGWARRIWSDVTSDPGSGALDFAPMGKESFVHLVVAGLTPMGEALVLQAVRVCHFPNGHPTIVTVVDPDPSARAAFFSRHPSLPDWTDGNPGDGNPIQDVRIRFLSERIESEMARGLLREAALKEDCLLSVAICFRHADSALSAALNLPEEIYWHRMPITKKDKRRAGYRRNGARIWVCQEHSNGLSEQAGDYPRYENLHPFGMQEDGFTPWCLREFCAMYLNAIYDWPNDDKLSWLDACKAPAVMRRIEAFRSAWADELAGRNDRSVFDIDATEKKNLLLGILAEGGESEVRRFQAYAFRKYVLLAPEMRWANVYVSDSYGAVFRALGLRAVRDRETPFADLARSNDRLFAERRRAMEPSKTSPGENEDPNRLARSLAEVEHNRWMADRALMGYRAPRLEAGEKRDDAFRYHNDMKPFGSLSDQEKGKDEISIACIPLFMALEGIRLEPTEERS